MSVSFNIDDVLAARMDEVAKALEQPREWVAEQAIEQYLAHQDWMDRKTQEAIADIDAGAELAPHEVVVAQLNEINSEVCEKNKALSRSQ